VFRHPKARSENVFEECTNWWFSMIKFKEGCSSSKRSKVDLPQLFTLRFRGNAAVALFFISEAGFPTLSLCTP
jgi:hypothetical protein